MLLVVRKAVRVCAARIGVRLCSDSDTDSPLGFGQPKSAFLVLSSTLLLVTWSLVTRHSSLLHSHFSHFVSLSECVSTRMRKTRLSMFFLVFPPFSFLVTIGYQLQELYAVGWLAAQADGVNAREPKLARLRIQNVTLRRFVQRSTSYERQRQCSSVQGQLSASHTS